MKADLALAGGGLANSLIAYRLARRKPEIDVVLLERGSSLGGQHIWSFHETDLTPTQKEWLGPFVVSSWPRHEVRFPARRRVIDSGYHSLTSARLDEVVRGALGDRVRLGAEVVDVSTHRALLADGTSIEAGAVIDGRGAVRSRNIDVGYQKFVGQTVELANEHGLRGPVLMDATVPQKDGYRFIYVLPFASRRLLIEDTYYSDSPALDEREILRSIGRYAEAQGWHIESVVEQERGVLPIVLAGDIDAFWSEGPAGVPRSGMRAGLFHHTTGYSLAEAVRLADELGERGSFESGELYDWIRRRSIGSWRRQRFFRLLNRMLYRAAVPTKRYVVLDRFYRLPEPLIHRFYAGRLTWIDKLRLVTGSPPVPIGRALPCLLERRQTKEQRRLEGQKSKEIS
ncbi:MAG: lycopene beta-cyclase CrtY [Acidobacteriota bacterium]|nr:MAG: lycopene beta-cyclase CrtY [Acidobacteriota bacterium]